MAVPLILLYEISIYVAKIFGKKPDVKKTEEETEEDKSEE
jgi:Sec-independent protein secretion pathway component TatC